MKRAIRLATIVLTMFGTPLTLRGQGGLDPELLGACDAALLPSEVGSICQDVVAGLQLLQPEAGLLLVGGNPVLGTASPIGKKFRVIPRVHIGGRVNLVFADVPDIIQHPGAGGGAVGTLGFPVPMPQVDVSVGVFNGFALGPTLGGFASVELLGSVSTFILPDGEGFRNDATGIGFGARIGVLRESFAAPGISVSGLYKWVDRFQLGDVAAGDDAQFGADLRVASFRAGLSKSFVVFGLALTAGWDRYESDVDFGVRDPSGNFFIPVIAESDPFELTTTRWAAAVDVSYIVLFFNLVGEVGWQESQTVILSNGDELESGKVFGAIGVRLSL